MILAEEKHISILNKKEKTIAKRKHSLSASTIIYFNIAKHCEES